MMTPFVTWYCRFDRLPSPTQNLSSSPGQLGPLRIVNRNCKSQTELVAEQEFRIRTETVRLATRTAHPNPSKSSRFAENTKSGRIHQLLNYCGLEVEGDVPSFVKNRSGAFNGRWCFLISVAPLLCLDQGEIRLVCFAAETGISLRVNTPIANQRLDTLRPDPAITSRKAA